MLWHVTTPSFISAMPGFHEYLWNCRDKLRAIPKWYGTGLTPGSNYVCFISACYFKPTFHSGEMRLCCRFRDRLKRRSSVAFWCCGYDEEEKYEGRTIERVEKEKLNRKGMSYNSPWMNLKSLHFFIFKSCLSYHWLFLLQLALVRYGGH